MKFFERACLLLFSIIIFVITLTIILIALGTVESTIFTRILNDLLSETTSLKITIVISVILLVLSVRFILFRSKKEEFTKEGIVLENTNGKLVITKESLENMILSSTKSIDGVNYVNSKTLIDKEHKLLVYVTIVVKEGIIVKEASKSLQEKIKETMKNTADLEVSSVSITVRSIVNKKNKSDKTLTKKEEPEVQISEMKEESENDENNEKE